MAIISTEVEREVDSVAFVAFIMCTLGAIFYCYEYYLRVAPSVVHPELMSTFNISEAGVGVLIAYYYFAYVPLQIPVGLMMDYWGPRKVLTFACLLCAVGTYMFASTESLLIAKVSRFMVGFGSAFAYVGVLKIANLWLPKKYFAMIAGFCTALGMIGAMSGSILMTKFINLVGWHQAFYSSAFIGIILAFVLWAVIRDKSDREIIKLERTSRNGMTIWLELLAVIKSKQLWINGTIGCLTFLPLTAFAESWAVRYLEILGLDKQYAAVSSSMVFLGYAVGGPLWSTISDLVKSRRKPLITGAITSAVMAFSILYIDFKSAYLLLTILFLLGFLASTQILVFAVGEDICHSGMSATTASFTNFLVMLGGVIMQPLVGWIMAMLQTVGPQGEIIYSIDQFRTALLLMPLGLVLAAILCLFLRETYKE